MDGLDFQRDKFSHLNREDFNHCCENNCTSSRPAKTFLYAPETIELKIISGPVQCSQDLLSVERQRKYNTVTHMPP